jgi:hypothetical protein
VASGKFPENDSAAQQALSSFGEIEIIVFWPDGGQKETKITEAHQRVV